ncbi:MULTISPECIES: thioredoxin family protein [unclassified Mucilaginibacter]|uniref:thioredoxin family protein n=1 Tax=unclassified Mucilaginibacter TaxID=2617802 RepID=UPI002AC9C554|nr:MULTISPECIES: thioredoxin family protein [unclassified Mucilaginibacter]MEB0260341.1 thioredoxin family protein [Mucilaginibacter sp. 10I4]MEB0279380.1 thioredoxin family protein [Mucilaginibacter sp. 10B2]MEB0300507.1 thioredoxin family protein [Mucilaginibacter sp. 5C4]WPX21753.1 thioredoxin family protein [Mucilaginibacter sp. 5C4]
MKQLISIILFALIPPVITWSGDFNEAQKEAQKGHKLIVINFSGSDWCGPCIRTRKEILETKTFEDYAAEHLVLVRADFPRQKKNQLVKEQVKKNEALADKYDPDGEFPLTLLVDENGKVLKKWEGFPNVTSQQFVEQIATANANR